MIPRWTRIHAELGDLPSPLTSEHVRRAVEVKLSEFDNLDWKSMLPKKGADGEHLKEEFAKDLAAMANSGGGLIVFGVSETRGAGTAEELKPLGATEEDLRSLRAVAGSRIRPTVFGLDIFTLGDDKDPGATVVVSIPPSQDAPHFIGDGKNGPQLGAPYRSGPETHWMRERDLEGAYRERFERRRSESRNLAAHIEELLDSLDLDRGAWIVAAARPHQPTPSFLPPPAKEKVTDALKRAQSLGRDLKLPRRTQLISELGDAIVNPRVGLRKWVVQQRETGSPDDKSRYAMAELYHDGTVIFAVALEGWFAPVVENRHHVPVGFVESFAAEFVTLIEGSAQTLGHDQSYSYRLELARPDGQLPYAAVDRQRYGSFESATLEQPSWSRTVRQFAPVMGEYSALGDPASQKLAASVLARDVLNQFGISQLNVLSD